MSTAKDNSRCKKCHTPPTTNHCCCECFAFLPTLIKAGGREGEGADNATPFPPQITVVYQCWLS